MSVEDSGKERSIGPDDVDYTEPAAKTEVLCTCGTVVEGGQPFMDHREKAESGLHEIQTGWLKQ